MTKKFFTKKKIIILSIIGLVLLVGILGSILLFKNNKEKASPLKNVDYDFDGILNEYDPKPRDNNFSGTMINSMENFEASVPMEFSVDYSSLVKLDNMKYNNNLARLCSVMSTDVYSNLWLQDISNVPSSTSKNVMVGATAFGQIFGMENVQYVSVNNFEEDKDDVTDYVIGHHRFYFDDKEQDAIFIVFRGTDGSNTEWSSNCDVGADTKEYTDRTGKHTDWTDKNNHKGFDVTATRAMRSINKYLNSLKGDEKKLIVITGHSRGAAIANIVGTKFSDTKKYKTFVYTFAAPNTTIANDANKFSYIMNLVNENDIVPCMPMEGWGFKRYGITFKVNGNDYSEEYNNLLGQQYDFDSSKENTVEKMTAIAKNREELYVDDMTDDGCADFNKTDALRGYSEELVKENEEILKKEKLYPFARCFEKEGILYSSVAIRYCPAYFLQTLANMACEDNPCDCALKPIGHGMSGKYEAARSSFVAASGELPVVGERFIGGMADPHRPETYCILANKVN